jgi:hypothetical protein
MALIIRVVLLLLLLGVGIALLVQNSVLIAITVLGVPTQPISVGWAIMAATILGLLVGVVLQYVLRGAPALRSPKFPWLKRSKTKTRRPKQQKTAKRANRSASNAGASDWYQPASKDWHDRPDRSPKASGRESPPEYGDAEQSQRSRWSNLFETEEDESSYPRREKQEPGSDRVVDADYRVIRPPTRPLTDPEWDDEFFEDRP